ncbi:MAG: LamB/YcsF family protein [Planctomycetota bacterium]|nr:MAG: LamB/YcsF family protein [Planctomycetota bacterium]
MIPAGPQRIDLNGDIGEGTGAAGIAADASLMESLSSVNIACGGHAGDSESMRTLVRMARERGLAIGAHPGFPDRPGFGRRRLDFPLDAVRTFVTSQIESLRQIAAEEAATVSHVKPHGSLYAMAAEDDILADAVACAVLQIDPQSILVGLSGSALIAAGRRVGLRTASEVFVDRGYEADGSLTPRGGPGSLLTNPSAAAARVVRMLREGVVSSRQGSDVAVVANTACIHGDTPGASTFAQQVKALLVTAGFVVTRLA